MQTYLYIQLNTFLSGIILARCIILNISNNGALLKEAHEKF